MSRIQHPQSSLAFSTTRHNEFSGSPQQPVLTAEAKSLQPQRLEEPASSRSPPSKRSQILLSSRPSTSSRTSSAKESLDAIIHTYQRAQAEFDRKEAKSVELTTLLETFTVSRNRSIQAAFRAVIDQPYEARREVTQAHRAETDRLWANLDQQIAYQRAQKWLPTARKLEADLHYHHNLFKDVYRIPLDKALAKWIDEANGPFVDRRASSTTLNGSSHWPILVVEVLFRGWRG